MFQTGLFAQKNRKSPSKSPESSQTAQAKPKDILEEDLLAPYRSSLGDVLYVLMQQQVNPYDIRPVAEDTIPKGDAGYRIHLISTTDRVTADTLYKRFKVWADSTSDIDFKLYGYFEFRSPSYRIHIGDFYSLVDANKLAARIQSLFPDAWVVRARIIQDRSPFYQRLAASRTDTLNTSAKNRPD